MQDIIKILEQESLISVILSTLGIASIIFVLSRYIIKSKYDAIRSRALLEGMRSSFEKEMYALNERLISSEERWKDVNHLLLRKEYLPIGEEEFRSKEIELNDFLKANGITKKDLKIDSKLIFVLTPFHSKYENDFLIIKQVCDSVGLKCIRGDEEFFSSGIFAHILRNIVKSILIIANINGRSPNVLYELGIAQALDKPTILISKTIAELPVDIKSKKFIIYKTNKELNSKLKDELIRVLTKRLTEDKIKKTEKSEFIKIDNYETLEENFDFFAYSAPIGYPNRNDHFYEKEIFDFHKIDFAIDILPENNTKFWRFGFTFSKNNEFPPLKGKRNNVSGYDDILICIDDESTASDDLNSIKLGKYPVEKRIAKLPRYENYDNTLVTIFFTTKNSISEISVIHNSSEIISASFDLSEYKKCRISAWADHHSKFKLNAKIKVKRKN